MAGEKVVSAVKSFASNQYVMWMVTLVAFVGIVVVAILIIKRLTKTNLQVSQVYDDIVSGNASAVTVPAAKIPSLGNGSEYGYSFWVLSQSGPTTTSPRFVFSHGSSTASTGVIVTLNNETNELDFTIAGVTATINYLPMNRWVHIVAVFADGVVTFFMDGDVYATQGINVPLTFAGPSGDMTVSGGSEATPSQYSGFRGYVGHITFINFYPSPGIRAPVYKINLSSSTCNSN